MEWYYVKDGEQQGPVSREELDRLVASGEIPGDTLVWHEGMENWEAHETLPAAGGQAAEAAAAPAAAAGPGQRNCSECGNAFPEGEMVTFGDKFVCPSCKPAFFQKVREGVGSGGRPAPAGQPVPGAPAQNGFAVAGLVVSLVSIAVGIVGLCCYGLPGIITAVVGLILSIVGLQRSKQDPYQTGRGMAIAGIIISAIMIVLSIALLIVMIAVIVASEGGNL